MYLRINWQQRQNVALIALLLSVLSPVICKAGTTSDEKLNGQALLEKEGCLHCHYVGGKGGVIGPPFEGIEKVRTEEDIVNTLTQKRPLPPNYPKGILDPKEFMRHVKVDKKTATAIAKYLMSMTSDEPLKANGHGEVAKEDLPGGFKFSPQEPSQASRKGLLAFKEAGCAACHSVGGAGGRTGPELDGIGARLTRTTIQNRIKNGATIMFGDKEYKPTEYSMPPTQLPDEQISQITEFLLTLPQKTSR